MKKIFIILGSVLFLFSTLMITAFATQIPVVGEFDYGNLDFTSLLNTYEYTIDSSITFDPGDGSEEWMQSIDTSTSPSFLFSNNGNLYSQVQVSWDLTSSVYVDKVYISFAVSELAAMSYLSYIELLYTSDAYENSVTATLADLHLYDQFYSNGYYYNCYDFYVSDLSSVFPEGFDVNRVSIVFSTDEFDENNYFISVPQLFTTSSLTYPILDSGVSIYATPSDDQTPGTYEEKHHIYGYPWELTVEDDRPQSIYFDRQQGLMWQSINYDYGRDVFIDKMKLVYFIVGDNPRFGVSILSQDNFGSLITSVPDFKVETGVPFPLTPVEWNGDEIMPHYYEVTIDLKGYNLEDSTINITCLVDALEDPNPNNANRINYFFFFGNFIGYYTKDLSQTVDPNLKWVTFIGDKLDAILENFKAPSEESMGSSNNLQQESDELHQIEDEIIGMLPSVDFNAVEGQVSALQGLQGQIKGNLILSSIASAGPVPQLMYLGLLMGVGAVLLFINKR